MPKRRCLAVLCITLALNVGGAEPDMPDPLDMPLAQSIVTPAVPHSAHNRVTRRMLSLQKGLNEGSIKFGVTRAGEVLKAVIPCSEIFETGSDNFRPGAADRFKPLIGIIKHPDLYRVVVVVHSDDTGDDTYRNNLTESRANAIDDYLWGTVGHADTNVVPYGIGADEPIKPNTSVAGRAANRRIEIYIIPERSLFD